MSHFVEQVERITQHHLPKRCQLEIPRANGGPESCYTDPCGRQTLTECADCHLAICEEHAVVVKQKGEPVKLKCEGCAVPTLTEIYAVLSDCADVISPKFYPVLLERIEHLLTRAGRPL